MESQDKTSRKWRHVVDHVPMGKGVNTEELRENENRIMVLFF